MPFFPHRHKPLLRRLVDNIVQLVGINQEKSSRDSFSSRYKAVATHLVGITLDVVEQPRAIQRPNIPAGSERARAKSCALTQAFKTYLNKNVHIISMNRTA